MAMLVRVSLYCTTQGGPQAGLEHSAADRRPAGQASSQPPPQPSSQLRNIVAGYSALVRGLNDELMVELMSKVSSDLEQIY